MTLSQSSNPSSSDVLRHVVRTVASTSSPAACLSALLESARQITAAAGGGVIIFKDQGFVVTAQIDAPSETLYGVIQEMAGTLQVPYEVGPPKLAELAANRLALLAAPLRTDKELLGLLWLVFDDQPVLSAEQREAVTALVDGLTIASRSVLMHALQDRLCRNQGEFIHLASHDLRSPLTWIKGYASILESRAVGELNEKQQYYVEKILSGVEQMATHVDRIQDAGRFDPETGFYEMERNHCDLIEMVEQIVHNHLIPAEKQALSIACDISGDVPPVNVDVMMLERAINNLIDNAIKYTPNGGQIVVGLERRADQIVVWVADDGYGISDDQKQLLFERHVRLARKEHKRIRGTGLGLFIVRSVARRHGGEAWVESVEGEGSTFYISIPLMDENLVLADLPDA